MQTDLFTALLARLRRLRRVRDRRSAQTADSPQDPLWLVRPGRCYECESPIDERVAGFGSLLCAECRDARRRVRTRAARPGDGL